MAHTDIVIYGILAFALGYGLAYFAKNIGDLFDRWGLVVSYFFVPTTLVSLLYGAAIIADLEHNWISIIYASGFLTRLIRR